MTSEIAIMNRESVALAADSAVTITERKIFTSVNKIFALSRYEPVGIMIYGNARFMEISWEPIIKLYRKNLGEKKFDHLTDYAESFIEYLCKSDNLFPLSTQESYINNQVYSYFFHIKIFHIIFRRSSLSKFSTCHLESA